MRGKYDFREPLLVEDSGAYITAAQMQFFLNRSNGEELFQKADERFIKYYRNCCLYNLVYDMMDKDSTSAKMYWDTTTQSVGLAFPVNGDVSKALSKIAQYFEEDDEYEDEDDDPFGVFE